MSKETHEYGKIDWNIQVKKKPTYRLQEIHVHGQNRFTHIHIRWLRLVGSLKLQVSFATEPYKRDDILQKRPIIWRSLLIVATPYHLTCGCPYMGRSHPIKDTDMTPHIRTPTCTSKETHEHGKIEWYIDVKRNPHVCHKRLTLEMRGGYD